MDRQENFWEKVPFYMTYPLQNLYTVELEYEKDLERMFEMFPKDVSYIQKMVEERFDELEDDASRIYDEEPDRLMIQKEIDAMYHKILEEPDHPWSIEKGKPPQKNYGQTDTDPTKKEGRKNYFQVPEEMWEEKDQTEEFSLKGQSCDRCPGCDSWLCSMVGVLFQNEMYRRRCRHRRCKRWW